jgi:hypothetical protein
VPEHHAARYVASAPVVAIALDEDWAVRHWKICVRDAETSPAAVQSLVRHLTSSHEASENAEADDATLPAPVPRSQRERVLPQV